MIDWIGRVLASRGMPLLLLERTLRILFEELVKALPDRAETYQKLLRSADILAEALDDGQQSLSRALDSGREQHYCQNKTGLQMNF
jgi:hypothetical protein